MRKQLWQWCDTFTPSCLNWCDSDVTPSHHPVWPDMTVMWYLHTILSDVMWHPHTSLSELLWQWCDTFTPSCLNRCDSDVTPSHQPIWTIVTVMWYLHTILSELVWQWCDTFTPSCLTWYDSDMTPSHHPVWPDVTVMWILYTNLSDPMWQWCDTLTSSHLNKSGLDGSNWQCFIFMPVWLLRHKAFLPECWDICVANLWQNILIWIHWYDMVTFKQSILTWIHW